MGTLALHLEDMLPATLTAPDLTESEFLELCAKFPDAFLEYTADGTVLIMPPTDPETGVRVSEVARQLGNWAKAEGSGSVLGSESGFRFPGGSRRSPDAAWFNRARWKAAQKPGTRFPIFAPEFVIEVRSPEDRLRSLQDKMLEYMENGVELGWLIDPQSRKVTVYRPGQAPEVLEQPAVVVGDGPVKGFVLIMHEIL
jgi:Uma2 family endonuclease